MLYCMVATPEYRSRKSTSNTAPGLAARQALSPAWLSITSGPKVSLRTVKTSEREAVEPATSQARAVM